MSTQAPTGSRWMPALAGYRALAALAVLVFHILSLDSPGGFVGRWSIPLGNAAVTVFFVLSGFLIYRPFVAWAFGDGPPVNWWRFIIRRASRILPLYWLVLTVDLFVIQRDVSYSFGEYATAYLLVQNFRGSMVFIPPFVAWSLCVELWFSFALPFVAAPLRWLGSWRPRGHRFRIQVVGIVLISIAAVLFRHWALQSPASTGRLLWVPAYLDWFGAGLVLAVLAHHWARVGAPAWARQVVDNPWVLGTTALVAYWTVTRLGLPGGFISPTGFQTHLQFSLQAFIGFVLLANATLPGSRINDMPGFLSTPLLTRLGAYGYGIYLIHSLVIDELVAVRPGINRIVLTIIVVPATILLSAAAHVLVERPASRLTNRYVNALGHTPLSVGLGQWSGLQAQDRFVEKQLDLFSGVKAASAQNGETPISPPDSRPAVLGNVTSPRSHTKTARRSLVRTRAWYPPVVDIDESTLSPGFLIVDVDLVSDPEDKHRSLGIDDEEWTANHEVVVDEDGSADTDETIDDEGPADNDRVEDESADTDDEIDLLTLVRSTRELSPEDLPSPAAAWTAAGGAFTGLTDTSAEVAPTHRVSVPDPVREMLSVLERPWATTVAIALISLATTILAAPGRYVADARFELFADPVTRLQRMFSLWDPTRDLGRVAEEFWPGVTMVTAVFSAAGLEPWLNQRLLHALLITMAGTGAMVLSRTLRPAETWAGLVVAVIYAFGPFSAIYLIPSTIYVSHVLAPWLVVAVLRATRGPRTLAWAGATTLAVILVGNADAPGLVFACVPAAVTWLALVATTWRDRVPRRRLWTYAAFTVYTTVLGSAMMLVKTSTGASALALRLIETESVETVAATTSFSETMRGMGLWLNLFRVGPVALRSHQLLFVSNPWGVAITFVPVLAAVLSLIWWRGRAQLLALAWLIVGVILAVGPHPVDGPSLHGRMLLRLYESSELAFGFRSTHKAGTIIALGVAVLGGWALTALAKWPARRLGSFNRAPVAVVLMAMAMLTQPFWVTPLYDPQFQSNGVAAHWEELGDWFADNPPDGRVLVVPGSTNNGYQWGRVGDDVLDPLIPNRVVASTLPLSTLHGADVIRELDRALTSPDYRAGTLLPLAERLGISAVVIRNDLDWQIQGLPPPSALDPLRADPDLQLAETFGRPGGGGAPQSLSPIEVYELDVEPTEFSTVSGERATIVVDGATPAALDLASLGLLDQGHLVRYGPELDRLELNALADHVALVVLTDSLVAEERRVNHYGYYQVPANDEAGPNPWLPNFAPTSFVRPSTSGAAVGSSIDRWLLSAGQPEAASDSDPDTVWTVPFLVESEPQTWWVGFDEQQPAGTIELDLVDGDQRLGQVEVTADGRPLPTSLSTGRLVAEAPEPYQRVEITLSVDRQGQQPVGIREVSFNGRPLVSNAVLSSRLPKNIVPASYEAVPLVVRLGPATPSPSPWKRTVSLWRDETLTFTADVEPAKAGDSACVNDILRVDGRPVSVRITPTSSLEPCNPANRLQLTRGEHTIELFPGTDKIGMFRLLSETWATAGATLGPVDRQPVSVGDTLKPDAIVTTPFSFDARWRIEVDGRTIEPSLADGLTTFVVPEPGGRFESVEFTPDWTLNMALSLTILGAGLALLALVSGRATARWFAGDVVKSPLRTSSITDWMNVDGLPRLLAAAILVDVLIFWFTGPWGLIGAVATAILLQFAGWRWAITSLGLGVLATAAFTVWPTLSEASVDPTNADNIGRIVVGGLMVVLVIGVRETVGAGRSTSPPGDVDDTVPRRDFP